MHEFKAAFTENLRISVYVSMHYRDSETAERVVRSFLLLFGQVPTVLKVGVSAIIVHPGDAFWAGGQKRTLVFHAARFDELTCSPKTGPFERRICSLNVHENEENSRMRKSRFSEEQIVRHHSGVCMAGANTFRRAVSNGIGRMRTFSTTRTPGWQGFRVRCQDRRKVSLHRTPPSTTPSMANVI